MQRLFTTLFSLMLTLSLPLAAQAEDTEVMVRVKANDSKYMGTSVGGLRVTVADAETGELLDEGWINGSTGDTDVLMKNPLKRGERQSDDDTAGYLANLDLDAPRLLRFTVMGPYGFRQAMQESSTTSWVVPGKDILGDGIILGMNGFIVDAWAQVEKGYQVQLMTKASLMCGCPITEEGLWPASDYEVKAVIMRDEKEITETTMQFTGTTGLFRGELVLDEPGHYKAIVYLFDADTGNVGVDRTMFEITDDDK